MSNSVLVATFTHAGNYDYFKMCLQHIARAMIRFRFFSQEVGNEFYGTDLSLLVVDFTEKGKVNNEIRSMASSIYSHLAQSIDFHGIRRPLAGFCSNMNYALNFSCLNGYDSLVVLNDDAFIHPDFIVNALRVVKKTSCVFVGGIPQEDGVWNSPLGDYYMPQPIEVEEEITNFSRLWWEMSACCIQPFMVPDIVFDTEYDQFCGLFGDNDYLIRLAQKGHKVFRSGGMRFWHARGVTQDKFGRKPFAEDPHRKKMIEYVKGKWGVDVTDINERLFCNAFKVKK